VAASLGNLERLTELLDKGVFIDVFVCSALREDFWMNRNKNTKQAEGVDFGEILLDLEQRKTKCDFWVECYVQLKKLNEFVGRERRRNVIIILVCLTRFCDILTDPYFYLHFCDEM
jgi:hypothetical protein